MVNEQLQGQYLLFTVDETYALALEQVVEILELQPITAIPETPPYIAGAMNLRGQILPMLDLRLRFHKEQKLPPKESKRSGQDRRCVVVVRFEEQPLGLIVDAVVDLLTITQEHITPPPQVGSDYAHVFVKAIGIHEEQMVLILESEKLICHSDLDFITEMQ